MANELAVMPLSDFQDICDAVRRKTQSEDQYTSRDLIAAIYSIPDGSNGGDPSPSPSPTPTLSGTVDSASLASAGWSQSEIDYLQSHVWWNQDDDNLWRVANADAGTYYKRSSGDSIDMGSVCAIVEDMPISADTSYTSTLCYLIDFGDNDMSNYTTMYRMFYGCSALRHIDCSTWNTSSVTSMASMFDKCYLLQDIDVSGWDTTNVTAISAMFQSCESLTSLDLRNWNTSKITSLNNTFNGCRNLRTLRLEGCFSNVNNITNAFAGCSALTYLDLRSLDWSKIQMMTGAFSEMYSLKHLYLDNLSKSIAISSSNLSHESLMYIINHMAEVSGRIFTIGAKNLAKLSADEKAIAIDKGWTLA